MYFALIIVVAEATFRLFPLATVSVAAKRAEKRSRRIIYK